MRSIPVILMLVLAFAGCGRHTAAPAANASPLAGTGASVAFVVGTVAPVGSFEWGIAPLQTEIRRKSDLGKVQLLKGEISPEDAQRQHDRLQNALELVGTAIVACKQDNKTGQCTGDRKSADRLIVQAQESMP